MKTSPAELKRKARVALKGNYGLCVGTFFVLYGILMAIMMIYMVLMVCAGLFSESLGSDARLMSIILGSAVFLVYLLMLSFVGLLMPGLDKIYLDLCKGEKTRLSVMFYAFQNKPLKFMGLYLANMAAGLLWGIPYFVVTIVSAITGFIPVMVVLMVLTYLLMLAGGIVTSLYLSQAMFVMIDSPDKKVFASLKGSIHMMKGHKGRLFWLGLTFTGMIFLAYGSMCVGLLWIMPYIQCTLAEFYLDLKEKNGGQPEQNLIVDHQGFDQNYYSGSWEKQDF